MKRKKASSSTLKEDYSWRDANAACETDAKLLFCPECFPHMQALEQVPPQPETCMWSQMPMVLTTAIGHPFSWSRSCREDNNQLSKHLAEQSLNSAHTRAHCCLVCQISTNTQRPSWISWGISTVRVQGSEGIALSTTVYEMRKHMWEGETHMRTTKNRRAIKCHDMCKVQWEER